MKEKIAGRTLGDRDYCGDPVNLGQPYMKLMTRTDFKESNMGRNSRVLPGLGRSLGRGWPWPKCGGRFKLTASGTWLLKCQPLRPPFLVIS